MTRRRATPVKRHTLGAVPDPAGAGASRTESPVASAAASPPPPHSASSSSSLAPRAHEVLVSSSTVMAAPVTNGTENHSPGLPASSRDSTTGHVRRRSTTGRRSYAPHASHLYSHHGTHHSHYRPSKCYVHNSLEAQRLSSLDFQGASEPVSPQGSVTPVDDEPASGVDESGEGRHHLQLKDDGTMAKVSSTASVLSKREISDMVLGVRELSKRLGSTRIVARVRSVMIVAKVFEEELKMHTASLANFLLDLRTVDGEGLVVYVEDLMRGDPVYNHDKIVRGEKSREQRLRYWTAGECRNRSDDYDFVITLGGDGTVLYTSWLFQGVVPPVLSFALGSLGFLTVFDFGDHAETISRCVRNGFNASLRMRFECSIFRCVDVPDPHDGMREIGKELLAVPPLKASVHHTRESSFSVLNELVVDRGPNPSMSSTELYGDEEHLTSVQADGLCISTPTGSTAYSLAAGGSLVHPEIPAMLISPICAHSLSFRPLLLPDSVVLRVAVPYDSRTSAWLSFDGRNRLELQRGDYVSISASRYPFPVVSRGKQSSDWIESLRAKLNWNERERQKMFFHS